MTYFLLEQLKKSQGAKKPHAKTEHGFTTWKDMLRKCVERYLGLANESGAGKQSFKSLGWIINSNKKSFNQSENSQVCSQIVSNMLELEDWVTTRHSVVSANLQEQSENGLRHATDDWQD